VRAIGTSTFPASEIVEEVVGGPSGAGSSGSGPISRRYSIINRSIEREVQTDVRRYGETA
jgi:hypothetical protein